MKVVLVDFLNAYPLYYALVNKIIDNDIEFIKKMPSVCARLLFEKQVDVGIAPSIEYAKSDYYLVPNVCISSDYKVKSVALFLKKPLNKVKTVKLDKNSNTSVALTKILFAYKYKLEVDYIQDRADCELVIGDNALYRIEHTDEEIIDLAYEWKEFSGYPFVFALWIANDKIPAKYIDLFLKAKEWGVNNLDTIAEAFCDTHNYDYEKAYDYLKNNLSYDLTENKKKSLELFFDYAYKLNLIPQKPKLRFLDE
ncbi:MAG: menaquinone biosynthetic enzyme MqnA/MqnD family protein [Desulfurella sp.]|uniref:Chorismate dehydratase n=1 Tax=Desulfurella multipotens TaxID=79269 RepID=A0A1G6Q1C6_9BACT|nr:menaquinone biosynthesis protein [Desulfurella multipotens]SDC85586.1 chorismate dehydratase [Desulfurella multipotens]